MKLVVVVLLWLAPLSACVADEGPASSSSEQAGTSAVGIEAVGCGLRAAVGSGAVLGEAGLVVTVAHTVAGAKDIVVIDGDGTRHNARLRLLDPASDIALLQVEGLSVPALSLGASPALPEQGDLLVWNRADGISSKPVEITQRLLVTIEDIHLERDVQRTAYEFAGSVDVGDSGGVLVVNESVVGMVYARTRDGGGRGFALDERELADAMATDREGFVDSGECVP